MRPKLTSRRKAATRSDLPACSVTAYKSRSVSRVTSGGPGPGPGPPPQGRGSLTILLSERMISRAHERDAFQVYCGPERERERESAGAAVASRSGRERGFAWLPTAGITSAVSLARPSRAPDTPKPARARTGHGKRTNCPRRPGLLPRGTPHCHVSVSLPMSLPFKFSLWKHEAISRINRWSLAW
ncbi:hypothetical protein AAFF_G00183640 [Aldrovandia affinis]|uniref:Uncharacterized protein n=1 Tax=Aldrovandia affinis TaxID=143900 RepID=A0AAD7RJX7_9TELE|nr:hypothetical protein AAFF_G00183640 [Aldrovandia affinis]